MRRSLTKLAAISLLLVFVWGAGFEPYDHWDHLKQSVNCVEGMDLLGISLCAALAVARFLLTLTKKPLARTAFFSTESSILLAPLPLLLPRAQDSPPPLRI